MKTDSQILQALRREFDLVPRHLPFPLAPNYARIRALLYTGDTRVIGSSQPSQFAAVGSNVMRGAENIARARSNNMADRIANALNRYTPDSRGK